MFMTWSALMLMLILFSNLDLDSTDTNDLLTPRNDLLTTRNDLLTPRNDLLTTRNDLLTTSGPDDPVWDATPSAHGVEVRQETSLVTLLNAASTSQESVTEVVSRGGKRGPGRPKASTASDTGTKIPAQRVRQPFPGRPTNRSRSRIKSSASASTVNLPPPPSLQLGARIKPENARSSCERSSCERTSCESSVAEPTSATTPTAASGRSSSLDTAAFHGSRSIKSRPCSECSDPIEESRLVSCDSCEKSFHLSCAKPAVVVVPKNGWKCSECRMCGDCGSRTPGNGPSSRWHLNFSVCDSCYQQRNKGNFCPICRKAYRQLLANSDMVTCTSCRKLVHPECDSRIKRHQF